VPGVAEVNERPSLGETVAQLSEQAESVPVARGGFVEMAELSLGKAEAVRSESLAVAGAKLAVQEQGLLAERACLLPVAEPELAIADIIQRVGLPSLVTDGSEQGEGPLGVAERVAGEFFVVGHIAQGLIGAGLASPVAELPAQVKALGQVGAGLVVVTEPGAGLCKQPASSGLTGSIPEAGRGP
jgi:hypothetical protein